MRQIRLLGLAAALAASVAVPAQAYAASGKPAVTGKDNAAQRIEAAASRQAEILTALLSKVPEQARQAIEKAMAAASEGHDRALAALADHGKPDGEGLDDPAAAGGPGTPGEAGKPQVTG